MQLNWAVKFAVLKLLGTDRGNKAIAFVESEAASAAIDLFKNNLLPAIIALLKKDWAGFYAALPDEWQPGVKNVAFLVAPSGSRSVGMINRLDGKGWVSAQSPDERALVNAALKEHKLALVADALALPSPA